jgi:hypothetical protein
LISADNQSAMSEIKKSKRGGKRKGAGRKPANRAEPLAGVPQKAKGPTPPDSRTEKGTFKPGVSGNPGGTPKGAADVRALARTYTRRAIERLAEWMEDDNPKASVPACVALINRGWGMPQQNVKATVTHLRNMTDDELIGFLAGDDEGVGGEGAAAPTDGSTLTH